MAMKIDKIKAVQTKQKLLRNSTVKSTQANTISATGVSKTTLKTLHSKETSNG